MSISTLIKYLQCENSREHKSKLQKIFSKEKVILEYKTPHMPHLNGITKRRFVFIKEGALKMLLKTKLNKLAHKIQW